jgi:hypothetical protein
VAQLRSNALVSPSGSLFGVLHECSHGILFPRTVWIASARYYLDDPSHRKAPIGKWYLQLARLLHLIADMPRLMLPVTCFCRRGIKEDSLLA